MFLIKSIRGRQVKEKCKIDKHNKLVRNTVDTFNRKYKYIFQTII